MTDWTKEDTEALGAMAYSVQTIGKEHWGPREELLIRRAAAHIETLEAACRGPRVLYEDGKRHADELVDLLQDRIATLEAANHGLSVLCEDGRRHADETIAGLRWRIDTLEAERAEVARELRALGKKIRDTYTHADDLAPGEAHDALAPIHGLTLELSGVAARLERKGE